MMLSRLYSFVVDYGTEEDMINQALTGHSMRDYSCVADLEHIEKSV
jgi:hypothetical protein